MIDVVGREHRLARRTSDFANLPCGCCDRRS